LKSENKLLVLSAEHNEIYSEVLKLDVEIQEYCYEFRLEIVKV